MASHACAVGGTCIHTYSLIHDDLPCMDDDDFRRGQPTCHKVFGEGVAVLAGDALLTIAFEILAQAKEPPRYRMPALITELAGASGSRWLIGGQVADLEGEGKKISGEELKFIHRSKTAALLTAAIRLGAMSANATAEKLKLWTTSPLFGQSLGLAFSGDRRHPRRDPDFRETRQERGQGHRRAEGDLPRGFRPRKNHARKRTG